MLRDHALTELADGSLVERARNARPGDNAPFNELVRRHQGHVRANCRFIVGNPQDAEDLAQDAFVKAYFALSSFKGRSAFKTWIRRIKVNRCMDHLDAQRRRPDVDIEHPSVSTLPQMRVTSDAEQWLEHADRENAVATVLDTLNDTLRVPLVMRDMDGFTYEEIAEVLGIGLSAAKMRVNRARAAFRAGWSQHPAVEAIR